VERKVMVGPSSAWGPTLLQEGGKEKVSSIARKRKNKARAEAEIYRIPLKRGRYPWLTPL